MNLPAISVIMPCYMAEHTIRRAIDSILAQTFIDWELILVDDGSPDNTGSICEEYGRIDGRIRVIHQENKGVAMARQAGLDAAKGYYTIHADPDDWMESKWLEALYCTAKAGMSEISVCNMSQYKNGIYAPIKTEACSTPKDFLYGILLNRVHASLCNKLIKRRLFTDNQITFTPRLNVREDFSVLYKCVYFAKSISFIQDELYIYNLDNTLSLTHQYMNDAHQLSMCLLVLDMQLFRNTYCDIDNMLKQHELQTLSVLARNGGLSTIISNCSLLDTYSWRDILKYTYGTCIPILLGLKLKLFFFVRKYVKIISHE